MEKKTQEQQLYWKLKLVLTGRCLFSVHQMPHWVLNSNLMKSTELNDRCLPKMHRVCPPHVSLLIFVSGIWLEIPASSLPPVILNLIRWLDAVNIPFYLDLYLSFDLSHVLLPIERMLIIAKQAFVLKVCFFFFFLTLVSSFFSPLTHDWWVQCEFVLCKMRGHYFTYWHQFYISLD